VTDKSGWELTLWQRLTYSVGMYSCAIVTATVMTWLLYFYSPPANMLDQGMVFLGAGLAVGLARLLGSSIDAISNPLVAFWSDRSRHPGGRRIPFIKRGAIPLMLFAILVWFPPVRGNSTVNVVWLAVTLSATWFFFTYVVAPYLALMPELTSNAEERVGLTVVMSYFEAAAMVIAALIVPLIIEALKGGVQIGPVFIADGFKVTATALAIIGGAGFFISVGWIKEKKLPEDKQVTFSLKQSVVECFKNPSFPPYLIAAASAKIAMGVLIICMPFIAVAVLHKGEGFTAMLMAPLFLSTIIGFAVAQQIVNRLGLRVAFLFATGAATVLVTLFFLAHFVGGTRHELTAVAERSNGDLAFTFGDTDDAIEVETTARQWRGLFFEAEGDDPEAGALTIPKRRFHEQIYLANPRLVGDPSPGSVRLAVAIGALSEPEEIFNFQNWTMILSTPEEREQMPPPVQFRTGPPAQFEFEGAISYADGSLVISGFRLISGEAAGIDPGGAANGAVKQLEGILASPGELDNVLGRFEMRVEYAWSLRIWLILIVCFILGFPAAILMSMYRPIVCEIVDLDEQRVGARREAMYFGVEGLLTKMADGISAVVAPGLMLLGHKLFPPPIGFVFPLAASSIFMVLAFIAFRKYPLGKPSGKS